MTAPAFDAQRLLARPFAPVDHDYGSRDSILYALGLGFGDDPVDARQLRFVYERAGEGDGERGGQQVVPTFANVLGYCGFWADQPDTGIDWRRLVHAEQSVVLHRPLAPQGRVRGLNRVVGLHDKGADRGALMLQERQVVDRVSGERLATVVQTTMLRGNGGFGGSHGVPLAAPHTVPQRPPDALHEQRTLGQAALLYRLNGDLNPLHADPGVARAAGFARPILHGLATMGMALRAVLAGLLDHDASAVRAMRVRFTAPVLPGDTLRTELWRDGGVVSLRTSAVERNVRVLDAGRLELG